VSSSSVASLSPIATPPTGFVCPHATRTVDVPTSRFRVRLAKAAYRRRGRGGQSWEKSSFTRAQAIIGAGAKPARNTGRWWSRLKKQVRLRKMNRRGRASLRAFAGWLMNESNQKTMTVSIVWAEAAEHFGVRERTVARWLETLRSMGMLVTIASGRSKRFTAVGDPRQNWMAVYTFSVPDDGYRLFTEPRSDSFVTPSPLRESSASWFKTGTKKITYDTMCRRAYARYARRHGASLVPKRQQLATGQSPIAEDAQLKHLARCLQHHSPADLRRIALKPILTETARFFRAGWQVADVLHALETRPDGTAWETNGAGGMRSVQAWLRLRLKAWLKDSQPMTAPSRLKSQAEAARRAEQARQRAQADAERRQRVSAAKDSPARRKARRMAAIIRCGSEKAARHQHPELFEDTTSQ
jgi:hypothetical protein